MSSPDLQHAKEALEDAGYVVVPPLPVAPLEGELLRAWKQAGTTPAELDRAASILRTWLALSPFRPDDRPWADLTLEERMAWATAVVLSWAALQRLPDNSRQPQTSDNP